MAKISSGLSGFAQGLASTLPYVLKRLQERSEAEEEETKLRQQLGLEAFKNEAQTQQVGAFTKMLEEGKSLSPANYEQIARFSDDKRAAFNQNLKIVDMIESARKARERQEIVDSDNLYIEKMRKGKSEGMPLPELRKLADEIKTPATFRAAKEQFIGTTKLKEDKKSGQFIEVDESGREISRIDAPYLIEPVKQTIEETDDEGVTRSVTRSNGRIISTKVTKKPNDSKNDKKHTIVESTKNNTLKMRNFLDKSQVYIDVIEFQIDQATKTFLDEEDILGQQKKGFQVPSTPRDLLLAGEITEKQLAEFEASRISFDNIVEVGREDIYDSMDKVGVPSERVKAYAKLVEAGKLTDERMAELTKDFNKGDISAHEMQLLLQIYLFETGNSFNGGFRLNE